MDAIIGLLKLALLGYSIYSAIVYFSRRSDNRSAFQRLRESESSRELTPEEALALNPFLASAGVGPNADLGVRRLSGTFLTHGLYGNGNTSEHNTIGEVDVLLPYDALGFVEHHNYGEVVLAPKCAVVVSLNGFTVAGARARSLAELATVGEEGLDLDVHVPEKVAPDADADRPDGPPVQRPHVSLPIPQVETATAVSQAEARYRRGETDVLGGRLETSEEIVQRRRLSGWAGVWRLGVVFVLLWIASWSSAADLRTWLTAGAVLMLAWSVWRLVRRPSTTHPDAAPQTVQRVRGLLREITMVDSHNARGTTPLFLGDTTMFKLPSHWSQQKGGLVGKVIEAEIRVGDHLVLGLGHGWSIADEIRRFPSVTWLRYLMLLLVGVLACLAVWSLAPRLGTEVDLAWKFVADSKTLHYAGARDLAGHAPEVGSHVLMTGQGRCELSGTGGNNATHHLAVADCLTVRWDGAAFDVPELDLAPELRRLVDQDFIIGHDDPAALILAAAIANLQRGSIYGDLLGRASAYQTPAQQIPDLGRTLEFVVQACKHGLHACDFLKNEFLKTLKEELGTDQNQADFADWKSLIASTEAGHGNATVTLSGSGAYGLRNLAREAANKQAIARGIELLPTLLQGQHGGAMLHTNTIMWPVHAGNYALKSTTALPENAWAYWADLQQLGTHRFALSGTVTERKTLDDGTPWFALTIDEIPARGSLALVYSLWWGLALVLILLASPLFLWRAHIAWKREDLLAADMAARPLAGEASVF